jgi:hypothetical protein
MTPKRLRKGGGELQMRLGQCIAHMRPEGRLGLRDPIGQLVGRDLFKVRASCRWIAIRRSPRFGDPS